MTIDAQIEAILFYKAEPVKLKELSVLLEKSEQDIRNGLATLSKNLDSRGLTLIEESDAVELRTSPETASLIEKIIVNENDKELTPQALETLTLVLYEGPVGKKDIDYIRGVNSAMSLRNLVLRGLIKKASGGGSKETLYEATTELLSHLGISKREELPDYETLQKTLTTKREELTQHES